MEYIWPTRLSKVIGTNTAIFNCPSVSRDYWWEVGSRTNSNRNIREQRIILNAQRQYIFKAGLNGAGMSYGYNDWGLFTADFNNRYFGLGGDIVPSTGEGEVAVSRVKNPANMIMLADSRSDFSWDGSIDPKEPDQWPSARHSLRANFMFAMVMPNPRCAEWPWTRMTITVGPVGVPITDRTGRISPAPEPGLPIRASLNIETTGGSSPQLTGSRLRPLARARLRFAKRFAGGESLSGCCKCSGGSSFFFLSL